MPDLAQAIYPTGPSNSLGNDPVGDDNYRSALNEMNLTPQEQNLYKMHLKNLTGPGGVDNPDGTRSTIFARTFSMDNKTFIIPTVWEGKKLSADEALQKARAHGLEKFPSYDSEDEANGRYDKMHSYMEKDTMKYFANRNR